MIPDEHAIHRLETEFEAGNWTGLAELMRLYARHNMFCTLLICGEVQHAGHAWSIVHRVPLKTSQEELHTLLEQHSWACDVPRGRYFQINFRTLRDPDAPIECWDIVRKLRCPITEEPT